MTTQENHRSLWASTFTEKLSFRRTIFFPTKTTFLKSCPWNFGVSRLLWKFFPPNFQIHGVKSSKIFTTKSFSAFCSVFSQTNFFFTGFFPITDIYKKFHGKKKQGPPPPSPPEKQTKLNFWSFYPKPFPRYPETVKHFRLIFNFSFSIGKKQGSLL